MPELSTLFTLKLAMSQAVQHHLTWFKAIKNRTEQITQQV